MVRKKKKKKEKPRELSLEELADVRALPISALAIARRARPRFAEQRFETVGDVENISPPRKLMLKCLIGEEDILAISKLMLGLYQQSLPERWKMRQIRANIFGRKRVRRSSETPGEEASLAQLRSHEGHNGVTSTSSGGVREVYNRRGWPHVCLADSPKSESEIREQITESS